MKGFLVRQIPGETAKAVARRQAEQLTLVRRRAQPTAVYIARLTLTAVFAYLLALRLPGASARDDDDDMPASASPPLEAWLQMLKAKGVPCFVWSREKKTAGKA